MNKVDKNRPVSSIKHEDKRVAIPDSAHQGEEQMAISGMPEQSEYDIFRHEFQRGRDPELYWLNKYKNDDEDNPDYMPQLRTDIRSLTQGACPPVTCPPVTLLIWLNENVQLHVILCGFFDYSIFSLYLCPRE